MFHSHRPHSLSLWVIMSAHFILPILFFISKKLSSYAFKTTLFCHSFFFLFNSFFWVLHNLTHIRSTDWSSFLLLAYMDDTGHPMDRITSTLVIYDLGWDSKNFTFLVLFLFLGNMQALKTQNCTDTLDVNEVNLRTVVINS